MPRSVAVAVLAAAALAVVVYWPSLDYEFVYDDVAIIAADERLDEPSFGYELWIAPWWPEGSQAPASRPLTTFTYWLQVQLHGRSEFAFHLVNVVLFALLSGAVAWLAWVWLRIPGAAWFVGLIFAAHPIHVEVAANIVGRAEILPAIFIVLGLGLYLKWRGGQAERQNGRAAERQPTRETRNAKREMLSWPRVSVLGLMILLAGLSKEHGYFLAPMLFLVELAERRREGTPLLARPWPWKLAAAVVVVASLAVVQRQVMQNTAEVQPGLVAELDNPLQYANTAERAITPLKLIGRAAVLLAAPMDQSPDYSPRMLMPTARFDDPLVLLGVAVIVLWAAATALARWRRHVALGPLLMLPVAWFIPSNTLLVIGTIFAERLMMTLSIFVPLAVAAAFVGWRWPAALTKPLAVAVAVIVTLYLGQMLGMWSLFIEADMLSPYWHVALALLVIAAAAAGWAWWRTDKPHPGVAVILGLLTLGYGTATILYSGVWRDPETLAHSTVLRHPMTGRFQGFFAWTLVEQGLAYPEARDDRYKRAEHHAKLALEYWPRQVGPYAVLAVVAKHRGEIDRTREYVQYLQRALGQDKHVRALLAEIGELPDQEAIEQTEKDLKARLAADPENRELMRQLADVQISLGNHKDGLKLYDKLDAPPSSDVEFLQDYAQALVEGGDLPKALEVYRRWIDLAPDDLAALTDGSFVAIALGDDRDEAKGWIERAMRVAPEASEPWGAKGEWHRLRGERGAAIRAYREALRRTTADDPKRVQYQLMIDKLTEAQ